MISSNKMLGVFCVFFVVVASLAANVQAATYADITVFSSDGQEYYDSKGIYGLFGNETELKARLIADFENVNGSVEIIHDGCASLEVNPTISRGSFAWVALFVRGNCEFVDKAENAASAGASGMIVVDSSDSSIVVMSGSAAGRAEEIVSVAVTKSFGYYLNGLLDSSTVSVQLEPGKSTTFTLTTWLLGHLVLFLGTISVIVLCTCLAACCKTFQRRQQHKRMIQESRQVLEELPTRRFSRKRAMEVPEDERCLVCAVCLEEFSEDDLLRTLPCTHEMHKDCVDPWLLEHDSCPCCRQSIRRREQQEDLESNDVVANDVFDVDSAGASPQQANTEGEEPSQTSAHESDSIPPNADPGSSSTSPRTIVFMDTSSEDAHVRIHLRSMPATDQLHADGHSQPAADVAGQQQHVQHLASQV